MAPQRKPKANTPAKRSNPVSAKPSKTAQLIALISRTEGASLDALEAALGWQRHSLRGSISQLRARGMEIERINIETGWVYRLSAAQNNESTAQ